MEMTKKAPSKGTSSDERTNRALKSAARWLQRRGAARSQSTSKRAYVTAAQLISGLAKKH